MYMGEPSNGGLVVYLAVLRVNSARTIRMISRKRDNRFLASVSVVTRGNEPSVQSQQSREGLSNNHEFHE